MNKCPHSPLAYKGKSIYNIYLTSVKIVCFKPFLKNNISTMVGQRIGYKFRKTIVWLFLKRKLCNYMKNCKDAKPCSICQEKRLWH